MSKVTIWTICPFTGKLEYCSKQECLEQRQKDGLEECRKQIEDKRPTQLKNQTRVLA